MMTKFVLVHILLHSFVIVNGNGITSDLLPNPKTCGSTSTQQRIVGGTVTDLDEFPWMALIGVLGPNNEFIMACGGSLINNRYVLTAAHCFEDPYINSRKVIIRLGEYDLSKQKDCQNITDTANETCADAPVDIPVENVIQHEDYNYKRSIPDDIALVRLNKTVTYSAYIKPICLPISSELNQNYSDATVAGWGVTENGTLSSLKRKLKIPIKSNSYCKIALKRKLGESQICAGGIGGKDSCSGDSGGPLMYLNENLSNSNWYVIGVVSFGLQSCGLEGIPAVYTRVSSYVEWIVKNLKD